MAYKIPESVLVVVHTRAARGAAAASAPTAARGYGWQSVTGSREPDDPDLEATARRELLEETGLTVGTLTDWGHVNRYEIWPQWRAKYAPDVTHNTEHVFGFLVDSATVATLDPAEHIGPALAALAGGDGEDLFAHKPRGDQPIAAAGSRAYWPGMTSAPKEASKLGQFSWALFDWANQPFFTVITTFIFAPVLRQRHDRRSDQGPGRMGVHAIDLGHHHRRC